MKSDENTQSRIRRRRNLEQACLCGQIGRPPRAFQDDKAEGLIKKLELEVFDNNPVAIELYRKHGFSEEGRRKKSILKNGVYIDVILMGMWLD